MLIRLRKLIVALRIYALARCLKKQLRRAERERAFAETAHKAEIAKLQKQLRLERHRARLREEALLDRVLHAAHLSGVAHATAGEVDSRLESEILDKPQSDSPPPHTLTFDQENLLADFRDNFFEQGRAAGKSETELENEWEREARAGTIREVMELIN